ncbi:MAG TPA: hypothetical protein VMV06_11250 [Acidimicrobiales bacterium]|nr:hypothetical protein [Acidimicrobiales bacterium]
MNDPDRFDPAAFTTFRVLDRSFDAATRTASLRYAFDDGPCFVETITFETATGASVPVEPVELDAALLHLHIAAGTSYYKAAAPPVVSVESGALSPSEVAFHQHLYDDGLREFAVGNGLPVPLPVSVSSVSSRPDRPVPKNRRRPGGVVVPIGGGKDSMVLIEALRPLGPRLMAVNPHPLVIDLARRADLELLVVRRELSPDLSVLNRTGALNGHVPVTAIVSLIAAVGAALYGYGTIAMAIERSASEETALVHGVPVNHQYSKSLDFERLMRDLLATSIDPGLTYGSALRPYSELAIARSFAALTEYHSTFCSCNTVFRQSAGSDDRWCGACAKCRFVGLMLAPFMGREALRTVIGRDMFADAEEIPGFAALMSDEDKPFECVGERRESAAALRMLADRPEWKTSPVVVALSDRARAMVSEAEIDLLLTPDADLSFPDRRVAGAVERFLAVRS